MVQYKSLDRKYSLTTCCPQIYTVESLLWTPLGQQSVLIRGVASFLMSEVLLIHKLLFPSVLNTEVSSFQGVGIEEFHCIQRCPHFRVLE